MPVYSRQTWNDNDATAPASAARFNHIEDELVSNNTSVQVIKESPLNVQWPEYNAKGDNSTDDTTAINSAINAAFGTGVAQQATVGNTVILPAGTYIVTNLTLKGGVHLRGVGPGGNPFSDTDAGLPPSATFIKAKAGVSADIIKTDNFATLDPSPGSATAYNTPERCGIYDMTIDGNSFNTSGSGRGIAAFARGLRIENVIVQNTRGDGIYLNGPSGTGETEVMLTNFRVTACLGNGVNMVGAHDTVLSNGIVANNGGIGVLEGLLMGTLMASNIHVYSSTSYNWQMGCVNAVHANCISDGTPGIQILKPFEWTGGAIYGIASINDELVCIGDGTTRTIRGVRISTRIFNCGFGGRMFRYRKNTTIGWNRFLSHGGNLGGYNANSGNFFASEGFATVTGPILGTVTSITVTQSGAPVIAGAAVVSDGVHLATITISSVTSGNILNISGTLGTAMNAGPVVVWNSTTNPGDTFEIDDANGISSNQYYWMQSDPSGGSIRTFADEVHHLGLVKVSDGNGHLKGTIFSCTGTPQAQVTGVAGDICFRTDGGAGTWIYRCTGTTNWTAVV